jgi:hypothetical protein
MLICCVALRLRRCDLRKSRPHSTILARLASRHPVSSKGQAFEQSPKEKRNYRSVVLNMSQEET